MLPATIDTERLRLRRPLERDATAIYKFSSDVKVTRWLTWPTCDDVDHLLADIRLLDTKWREGREYYWVITAADDQALVGSIACRVSNHTADLGFVIDADRWGEGFASEAAAEVLGLLAKHKHFHRVVAVCDIENTASARVLQKIGMRCRGTAREFMVCPNISDQLRDARLFTYDCDSGKTTS